MMATTHTTSNMGLILPIVGTRIGPYWADDNDAAFEAIDAHDHTSGKGARVPAAGLDINADLDFGGNDATTVRSVRFDDQAILFSGGTDLRSVYSKDGDLYYRNESGDNVQITDGASLDASALVSNLWPVKSLSADHTVNPADEFVFFAISTTGGARTITLPKCDACPGKFYVFKQVDGNLGIILTPDAADLIDGGTIGATKTLNTAKGEWILYSDGAGAGKWHLLRSSQELNGVTISTAGGALATGKVLRVTGTSTADWGAVDLADTDAVTGVLPHGNMEQADATFPGTVQLAQDLGGIPTAPTVTHLTGVAGACLFRNDVAGPSIGQDTNAGLGGSEDFTVQAQSKGTGSTAGRLLLRSGSDGASESAGGDIILGRGTLDSLTVGGASSYTSMTATAAASSTHGAHLRLFGQTPDSGNSNGGDVALAGGNKNGSGLMGGVHAQMADGTHQLGIVNVASGRHATGLNYLPTSTDVPSGSGVVWIKDALTLPTSQPVNGALLFSDSAIPGLYSGAAFAVEFRGTAISGTSTRGTGGVTFTSGTFLIVKVKDGAGALTTYYVPLCS